MIAKSKNGKNSKLCKKQIDCVVCGNAFYPDSYDRKFCGVACYRVSQRSKIADEIKSNASIQCSLCHAKIGFGVTISARLLKVTTGYLQIRWKALGAKQQKPDGKNSWRDATAVLRPFKKIYYKQEIDVLYLSEYKVKFPDWSALAGIKKLDIWITKYLKDGHAVNEHTKKLKIKNKESSRKSTRKRKIIDPGFKVQCNLRRRLRDIIKSAKKGGWSSYSNLTGCTSQELAAHIEKQFKKGMTWGNYGIGGWHVDHIMPCSKFDHTNELHVRQCWHFTNLRPLWAKDNLAKSDVVTHPQLQLAL